MAFDRLFVPRVRREILNEPKNAAALSVSRRFHAVSSDITGNAVAMWDAAVCSSHLLEIHKLCDCRERLASNRSI